MIRTGDMLSIRSVSLLVLTLLSLLLPPSHALAACAEDDHFYVVQCTKERCRRGFEVTLTGNAACEDFNSTLATLPENYLDLFYRPLLILNTTGLQDGLYVGRAEARCLLTIRNLLDTLPPDRTITWRILSPSELFPEKTSTGKPTLKNGEAPLPVPPNPLAGCNFSLQEYSLGAGYFGYLKSYLYWSFR